MILLVFGPSGVGKSDYGRHAEETIPECQFFDLDSLISKKLRIPVSNLLPQIGNDAFLDLCQREVEALLQLSKEDVVIVAVGSGALQSIQAHSWLSQHSGPTIAVIADTDEVYHRGGNRNLNRTLKQFIATEYSQHRKNLYELAKYSCCVTGLSLEEARSHFTDMICSIAKKSK